LQQILVSVFGQFNNHRRQQMPVTASTSMENLTDKRARLIQELETKLSLLKDDSAILKLEEQEKKLLAELQKVRIGIDSYRDALGLPPRAPAGTQMAPPAKAAKLSTGQRGPNGPRTKPDDMLAKLVDTLKAAGPNGLSVTELANKSGVNYQTVNNFRNKNTAFAGMLESVKDGRSIILSLKAEFMNL